MEVWFDEARRHAWRLKPSTLAGEDRQGQRAERLRPVQLVWGGFEVTGW